MNTKIIADNISLSISEAVDKNIAEQVRFSGKDSSKEINVNQNVASDSNNLTDIQFPPYIIDSTCTSVFGSHHLLLHSTPGYVKIVQKTT